MIQRKRTPTQTVTLLGQKVSGDVEWKATDGKLTALIHLMRTIVFEGPKRKDFYRGTLTKGKKVLVMEDAATLKAAAAALNKAAKNS